VSREAGRSSARVLDLALQKMNTAEHQFVGARRREPNGLACLPRVTWIHEERKAERSELDVYSAEHKLRF